MRNFFKVAIVGGGASGLLCAVELLSNDNPFKGEDIVIIERNDRVGKKLLATGNGQGNLSNLNMSSGFYHGDKKFIDNYLSNLKNLNLEKYFFNIGIPFITEKNGKQYPVSKQASAVLDCLRSNLAFKNCQFKLSEKVKQINRNNKQFEIVTDKGKIFAENVVIAIGGSAGKQFGTDGSSYSIVKSLGHTVSKLYPSLVQLKCDTKIIKGLKGLKENVRVSAFDGEKYLASSVGDLLFTDYGVSGNSIFSISSYLVGCKNPKIIIEFLPDFSFEETVKMIEQRKSLSYINKEDILAGIINKKIGQAVLKSAKSDKAQDIANEIKNFTLNITGSLDFSYAQVTKGGVKTSEISVNFESKLIDNLFLIGEVVDIDGDCGGYNLSFAFTSGIISAMEIKNRNRVVKI